MVNIKEKYLYLYLDNETMTGYVGETQRGLRRYTEHKKSNVKARADLVKKVGKPVPIKTNFKNMTAIYFAEHAAYEMYKDKGYDMLQDPPHPNIFAKYKDRIDDCKICDELGCDFTKERLEYILAVHRVSKLCPGCNKPFYYDSIKHSSENDFNKRIFCSYDCMNQSRISGSYNISKLCNTCNKPFYFDKSKYKSLPAFNQKFYCSYDCTWKGQSTGSYNVSKLCPTCNKPYYYDKEKHSNLPEFNRMKYCSEPCAKKGFRTGSHNVSKLCPTCNKPFYFKREKHRGIPQFNRTVYCSNTCSVKGKWNLDSYNISKLCPGCNKPFYFDKEKHFNNKFKKQIYCSHNCYSNSKRSYSRNVSKLCPVCNKPFYFNKEKYRNVSRFNERTHCSYGCSDRRGKVHSNE
jgi:hypothetical protein